MLSLGIRYLTGSVVACDAADRRRVEWPPHPARVFMALAAAHFESGSDPGERAALEWLETLPPPEIYAAPHIERALVGHYVPVNDKVGPSSAPLQSVVGLTRKRQPRTFSRAWLEDDIAYVVWPEAAPEKHLPALASLCAKVSRVGHSMSLVHMWGTNEAPDRLTNWLPDELHAAEQLRVAGPGSLQYLEERFNGSKFEEFFTLSEVAADASDRKRQRVAKAALREKFQNRAPVRLRPDMSLSHGYSLRTDETTPPAEVGGTVFDPRLLVFGLERRDGPYRRLDSAATIQLTGRFREAMLRHLGAGAPESLMGHDGHGPSQRPHTAFLALPFVGREHAHGGILGLGVAVPRDLSVSDRQRLLQALSGIRREGLRLGELGYWNLVPCDTGSRPFTLRDRVWTAAPAGARWWATVTPYVYDRHPKAKDRAGRQKELAEAIRTSWGRVCAAGFSKASVDVAVTPVSAHLGAPASHEFPRLSQKDGSERRHTHAILFFDRPVVGPVLLGAGRYRGYGLCRPLEEGS